MSMLTPPGMGGKYRITGSRYPRMRRSKGRRRFLLGTAATAVVLALALVGWGVVQLVDVFTGSDTDRATAGRSTGQECKASVPVADAEPLKLPEPAAITVNVYNATDRTGLAKDTAEQLEKRGFRIGAVDNAPEELDKKVKAPGLLLGTPKSERDGALAVLGAHLAKAQTKTDRARKGDAATSVDLVLGDGYRKLTPPATAARTLTALANPAPSTSPCD
ncbi:LytR C-terminal domain-containing protein [Streptomyces durbertensis]|uniref:LytR C-terminal domain-containing protein n=1 Tax=Streptomyces durbertensis TaxID=2448886 RepID=A0ABR6ECX5_9ACTN|nr:LytR C-terminal domain-containing protein [Streptomyces durbertensis]MBB1243183.1 LytR C-terminal domain-containing protein [Streptomyces durbertensis]